MSDKPVNGEIPGARVPAARSLQAPLPWWQPSPAHSSSSEPPGPQVYCAFLLRPFPSRFPDAGE
eukprot:3306160-Pyramimonas_sp.AAC.1